MLDYQRVRCLFFGNREAASLWPPEPAEVAEKDAAVLSKELQSRAGLSWRHPWTSVVRRWTCCLEEILEVPGDVIYCYCCYYYVCMKPLPPVRFSMSSGAGVFLFRGFVQQGSYKQLIVRHYRNKWIIKQHVTHYLDVFCWWFFTDSTMVNHHSTTIWGIFFQPS